ncbi:MAG TPA: class I SAM-dependent methyltransferase [Pseudobacteroides sp.]|uniref:class I SAM-dependent DNA methyltransferase n=1 Tax=Pseudobacteroides sp. TaxID=1968840 RepID=UPI002F926669
MYNNFAYVYDKLMYDVDYKKWSDYIESIFKKYSCKPSLMLDLGCGTGSVCINLAEKGYEMIGVDLSCEMLSCASEKSKEKGLDILYLNQDITEFELYGTVDAALCLMDTINYITDKRKLKNFFKLAANYLNPGGLLIFDINSEFKLENTLGNNVLYEVGKDITYIWANNYNRSKRICEFDLTFFVENQGKYDRFDELHYERAYSIAELKTLISSIKGMELLGIYDQFSFRKPETESERIFFVCRKSQ